MEEKYTEKILRNPQVLQKLITHIDTDPGEITKEGHGHRLVAGSPADTPMADIYMGANGGVYVIAYSIGPGNPEHLALCAWASKIAHKVIPRLHEYPARIITITGDSVEIMGLPAVSNMKDIISVFSGERGVFFKHIDTSSASIGELLAFLKGKSSSSNTELGLATKEALEG